VGKERAGTRAGAAHAVAANVGAVPYPEGYSFTARNLRPDA
jgi:hypothetical protein